MAPFCQNLIPTAAQLQHFACLPAAVLPPDRVTSPGTHLQLTTITQSRALSRLIGRSKALPQYNGTRRMAHKRCYVSRLPVLLLTWSLSGGKASQSPLNPLNLESQTNTNTTTSNSAHVHLMSWCVGDFKGIIIFAHNNVENRDVLLSTL